MKKLRVLAVLAIVLMLSITCLTTNAQAAFTVASGSCGNEATWTLGSDGTLTISGKGAMYDYESSTNVPWKDRRESVSSVIIQQGITRIGNNAFYYCENLTSITIPNGVTSIGNSVFYNCERLENITIPNSVTSIGYDAFYFCESINSITIPNGVTSIGKSTFYCCESLTNVKIPNTVTNIGYNAFHSCESLTSISIPDSVTSIGEGAFYGCSNLTSVTISNGITAINNETFAYCKKLIDVTIPESVSIIGSSAFNNCENLTSVKIPNGVITISDRAFLDCKSLTGIQIPKSVTSIGESAFSGCSSLSGFHVSQESNMYTSVEGVLFSKDKSELVVFPGGGNATYRIPYGVTSIASYAFNRCKNLTDITISNSVSSIGERAFGGCSGLTSVTIPDSVTNLGADAFNGCSNLSSIKISNSITDINSYTFAWCSSLTNVTIPNGVSSIGERAFFWCEGLTSVMISGSVTSIDAFVFDTCSSLQKIVFMGDAPELDDYAFGDTSTTVYYPHNNPTWADIVGQNFGGTITWATHNMVAAKITAQPKTAYAKSGNTVKTTLKAEGDGLTYQWYIRNADQSKYSKSSVTSATYSCKMSSTTKDRRAYCVITDQYGFSVKSNTVVMRMAATITTQPKSASACEGSTVKVTVKASGDGLKYQWYVKNAGKDSFSKSSITKATYSVEMSDKADGRKIYCVVTDKYGKTAKSDTVTLTMKTPLKITTQPKSVAVEEGVTAKVTVKATGDGLKYQWYIKNAGKDSFSKSSVTKSTYSVEMSDKADGRKVYCVVTDKYGETVKSNTVTLTMKTPLKITTQPKSVKVEKGETAKVTVKASGDGLKYQWYIKNAGKDSFSKSSVTKSTYSVEMSDKADGRKVYCVVTDKYGKTAKSDTATLTMKVVFEITTQPKSVRVDKGDTAKVTVKATGKDLTYQWYYMNAGQTKFSKSSVTKSTYSVEMSNKVSGRQVYCVVKDASGKKLQTNTVILNITGGPEITAQPKNKTVAAGKSVTLSVDAEGKGLSYEWYFKDPKDNEYRLSAAISDDPSTYSFLMLEKMDGRKVFCVITDSSGRKTTSKTITIKLA